jgi:hypothetical protein
MTLTMSWQAHMMVPIGYTGGRLRPILIPKRHIALHYGYAEESIRTRDSPIQALSYLQLPHVADHGTSV